MLNETTHPYDKRNRFLNWTMEKSGLENSESGSVFRLRRESEVSCEAQRVVAAFGKETGRFVRVVYMSRILTQI